MFFVSWGHSLQIFESCRENEEVSSSCRSKGEMIKVRINKFIK